MPKIRKDIEKSKKKESQKKANVKAENKKAEEKAIKKYVKNEVKKSKKIAKKEEKKSTKKVKNENSNKKTVQKSNKKVAEEAKKDNKKQYLLEYYDLPYKYNETVVKILVQTPKKLFVYWEVSEKDRETYINAFGEDFFEKTYPVLLVHNEEFNYTFEVPINDFANSWYIDIKDPKTKYVVMLGRKFKNVNDIKTMPEIIQREHINLKNDFIYITDSNRLEAPNDHVLFEKMPHDITYRNVKNGMEMKKNVKDILSKLGKGYMYVDAQRMYKELYGDEIFSEEILSNPSSMGLNSSSFK